MANTNLQPKKNQPQHVKVNTEDSESLKGTFVSVLLLGGFIVLTWFGVYLLFTLRNM